MQQKTQTDFTILLIGFIILIAAFCSSCVTSGYGCHGNSKIMTRVR